MQIQNDVKCHAVPFWLDKYLRMHFPFFVYVKFSPLLMNNFKPKVYRIFIFNFFPLVVSYCHFQEKNCQQLKILSVFVPFTNMSLFRISIHITLNVYHAACCVKFISVYDSSINTIVELLLTLATKCLSLYLGHVQCLTETFTES